MVNQYYFYALDRDFGPFFLKFCSYFPYNAKLCINGHEYAKRQLERRGIRYQALDNGVLSCEDPATLQSICDGLSAEKMTPVPVLASCRTLHGWGSGRRYPVRPSTFQAEPADAGPRPAGDGAIFEEVIRTRHRPSDQAADSNADPPEGQRHRDASAPVITEGVYPSST
jgi:hypothetical protein